ncbi:MAG: GWxTD domain-containing protein, partial [Candidatus Eisenbacteria sp.]|nr:GWxTD domain-containing protein [Candidatus Eisenbacteria bacterium]
GEQGLGRLSGTFQVLWDANLWNRSEPDRLQEAALLLGDKQWCQYRQLSKGQQGAFLESLWVCVEKQEGVAGEELRALFMERVAVADARFQCGRRGSFTDRGRVYVRFGAPSEIHKELSPKEEDLLYFFLQREIDDAEITRGGGPPKRHPLDHSAYEVWHYIHQGEPLLRDWVIGSQGRSLRFIFVDEMGNGDYRLIHSNLLTDFE